MIRSWLAEPPATACRVQKDWLMRSGSLTQRLRELGAVRVEVLRERPALPWFDEAGCLGINLRGLVWVRDVVLLVDDVPFVTAHSIVSLANSIGVWRAIRHLRNRPLAELLYSDGSVMRASISSRRVDVWHPLGRQANAAQRTTWKKTAQSLLARRSVFKRYNQPLLVTECMLPPLWRRVIDAD
jgi:chorismate--pyruvate lyase